MNYFYGKLSNIVEKVEYDGAATPTAIVTVDNEKRIISVDVQKISPTLLDLPQPETAGEYILQQSLADDQSATYEWVLKSSLNESLQQLIEQEMNRAIEAERILSQQLQQEVADRTAADQRIDSQMLELTDKVAQAEEHTAQAVEKVNQVEQELTAQYETVRGELQTEQTQREAGDENLQAQIDSTNQYVERLVDATTDWFNSQNERVSALEDTGVLKSSITGQGKITIDIPGEREFKVSVVDISDGNNPDRHTITLKNNDSISSLGANEDSNSYPLIFQSKFGVTEVGSQGVPLNLNSSEDKVKFNDSHTLLDERDKEEMGQSSTEAIEEERNRALQAEQILQENIEAEAARATQAEQQLQSNLDAEASERVVADEDLQSKIDKEISDRDTADKTLWNNLPDGITSEIFGQLPEQYNPNLVWIAYTKDIKTGDEYIPHDSEYRFSIDPATPERAGVMTAEDKAKVDDTTSLLKTAGDAVQLGNIEKTLNLNSKDLDVRVNSYKYVALMEEYPGDPARRAFVLKNNDTITGTSTTGDGATLIMMNKWDAVDVGSPKYRTNLNAKDHIVTVNDDTKVVLTKEQLPVDGNVVIYDSEGNIKNSGTAISSLNTNVSELQSQLNQEKLDRAQADTNLDSKIDSSVQALNAKDAELQQSIQSETDRATSKENSLQTTIEDISTRVGNLEGKTTRLFYNGDVNPPTSNDINDWVISQPDVEPPYAPPFEGIAVVVLQSDGTYHIWHYYSNLEGGKWQDDGVDTVTPFTNSNSGIIQGRESDGYISVDGEAGFGKVYGWDTVKSDTATSNLHIANKENPHNVTKAQVGLGNVDNTSDIDKPISTATQGAIDAEESRATNVESQLQQKITAEETARTGADTTLQSNIDAEVQRATAKEKEITTNLTAETQRATQAEQANASAISKEVADRTNADAVLQTNIDNEVTRAQAAEQANADAISTEESRAQAAEQLLSTSLNEEIARAKAEEQKNAQAISDHTTNKENPHAVTKEQVGLGNVDNTADSAKPVSIAQAAAIADAKEAGTNAQSAIDTHAADKNNPHSVTKAQLGLENVDNTSDLNKPVSTATQEALNTIQAVLDKKVDKVDGKQLSTEDYTTADKTKLGAIPTPTADNNGKALGVTDGAWGFLTVPSTAESTITWHSKDGDVVAKVYAPASQNLTITLDDGELS